MVPMESAFIRRLRQRLVKASSKKYARARRIGTEGGDYNRRPMSIVVGVAGGTGSGKTSFASKIRDRLGPERCVMIAQDSYYKDGSALTAEQRAAINYDHPDAFDTSL